MIEQIIPVREIKLVGDLKVKRVLPFRSRRMVGPFTFLDEMGPIDLHQGTSGDVPPHPHIGLSTVTYLFEGELVHRDGLGTRQAIFPGDVNWMTSGRGIAHSERIPKELRSDGQQLHGMQAWVALPLEAEEAEPRFDHYSKEELPNFKIDGVSINLLAGEAFGHKSCVRTHSNLFYFNARIPASRTLTFKPSDNHESAFYLVDGKIAVDDQFSTGPVMIVFTTGSDIRLLAHEDSHGLFLGGAPLEGPRYIWWNFVSSSKERIEKAKQDWRDQRFAKIPDESEFVPLPGETQSSEKSTLP